jgi:serine protease Do
MLSMSEAHSAISTLYRIKPISLTRTRKLTTSWLGLNGRPALFARTASHYTSSCLRTPLPGGMRALMFRKMIRMSLPVMLATAAWGMSAGAQVAGLLQPASLAPLVRAVAPVVVGISVSQGRLHASGTSPLPPISEAAGSGFIVTPDGMIVTNNHVITDANKIMVTLNDGEQFRAKLVGSDDLTDIAIIKIASQKPLPVAVWGDSSKMQVGDWILAAGNPFALGNSFTAGIISAEGRDIGDGPFDHFLQLDAPINPGNSGGPSFDMEGAVIGINTAIVSPSGGSVGIGFAIPSNTARGIVSDLIAHGAIARGWLGVSVADQDSAPSNGARVTGIEPGGPADRAGLSTGEVVLAVDGTKISGSAGLIRSIASAKPGAKVVLTVSRDGHIIKIPVVVDRRPGQLGG